jgi:hypothetical protein
VVFAVRTATVKQRGNDTTGKLSIHLSIHNWVPSFPLISIKRGKRYCINIWQWRWVCLEKWLLASRVAMARNILLFNATSSSMYIAADPRETLLKITKVGLLAKGDGWSVVTSCFAYLW